MNNIYRTIFNLVLAVLLTASNYCLQGQNKNLDELGHQFKKNVTHVHQEKIFVHTDRNSYITGETMWFSAYCMDASLHVPLGLSSVLSLEIVDSEGRPFEQVRVKLGKGYGNGQIFISPEIPSGTYILRAYTNWMLNFDGDFAFQKEIQIVNPSVAINENTVDQSIFVKFFPEGGNLVYGLKSKVAVKSTDQDGNGLKLSGLIFDNENNEVTKFSTSKTGYTSFYLTPMSGSTYVARVAINGIIRNYKMPTPEKSGLAISVKSTPSSDFNISLQSSNTANNSIFLIVHSRGIIKEMKEIALTNKSEFELKSDLLFDGISHITVLNSEFEPMAERLVFKYPNGQSYIGINTNKDQYNKREKINISLNLDNLIPKEDMANISVSVFKSNADNDNQDNIVSNLLLTSDIKGHVPNAWSYFDPKNSIRERQIDLIMLTNGWRRFDWSGITSENDFEFNHPAELYAPIISGRIEKDEKGDLPNSVQLSLLGKSSIINSFDLDDDGVFHFEVPYRVNNEKMYFFIAKDTLQSSRVLINSPFDISATMAGSSKKGFSPKDKNYFESLNSNIQVSQVYREFNKINGSLIRTLESNTHFYGIPDHQYFLDNYTRFETVKDLFIEYIRSAVIRDNNKKQGFYVINDGLLPGKALTLIDGVPILDSDYVLNFDPLKFEKIGVVNDNYYMGSKAYYGIINFTTYKGNFGEEELPSYLVEKAYHALQKPREFYSPDYGKNGLLLKRIPDYRNTLYWNPSVSLDASNNSNLEFYSSDDTGFYEIEINGITTSGQPIYGKGNFMVKENLP